MTYKIEEQDLFSRGGEYYLIQEDEPSNRFHFQWADTEGNVHIVDIQGWFRELVPMPRIEEVDTL